MRITALKVGGRRYRVETYPFEDATDDDERGSCNLRTGIIRIASGYAPDKTAETVIHEALHAIVADAGIGWSHEDEERAVSLLAPRIAALLADNEDVVHELLDMLLAGK